MNYLATRFQPSKLESTVGQQQLQWHTKPSRKLKIQSSRSDKILRVRGNKSKSHTIVPLPLIFRPDLETDGFWSVRTGAASRSFLKKLRKFEYTQKNPTILT